MTELIPYSEFAKLRLKQFVPNADIDETPDWKWMGGIWISEGIGFTSFCRLETTPDETGGLELDFRELSQISIATILEKVGLRLRPGMSFEELESALGSPIETHIFVEDRKSHDFNIGVIRPYLINATVHETEGLIHLAVLRKDVLTKIRTERS